MQRDDLSLLVTSRSSCYTTVEEPLMWDWVILSEVE